MRRILSIPPDLVIPETIDGYPVTILGTKAFNGEKLSSVIIPSGVKVIGNLALANNKLDDVDIPDGVEIIEEWAFFQNQLTSITIPDSVIAVKSYAFYLNQLSGVTFGSGLRNIGKSAFSSNDLSKIFIPESVTNIGKSAFGNNPIQEMYFLGDRPLIKAGSILHSGDTVSAIHFCFGRDGWPGTINSITPVGIDCSNLDATAPVISLLGEDSVVLYIGDTYVELGATADSGEDVGVSGFVNTSAAGTYTLTYTATDDAGNQAIPIVRNVVVTARLDDNDWDGIIDSLDPDDDNDGIPDSLELLAGRDPLATDYMVAVGDKYSCALDGSGVSCWGDSANGKLDVPDLINPKQIAVGFDHACAIDDTGVVCWGADQYNKTEPPALSNPTKISLGRLNSCAIDDTGVVCWGINTSNRSTPPALSNPTDLDVGADHACAIDDTGLVCWGKFANNRGKMPSWPG